MTVAVAAGRTGLEACVDRGILVVFGHEVDEAMMPHSRVRGGGGKFKLAAIRRLELGKQPTRVNEQAPFVGSTTVVCGNSR